MRRGAAVVSTLGLVALVVWLLSDTSNSHIDLAFEPDTSSPRPDSTTRQTEARQVATRTENAATKEAVSPPEAWFEPRAGAFRILDIDGEPVPHCRVRFTHEYEVNGEERSLDVLRASDAHGMVSFVGLQPGDYLVSAVDDALAALSWVDRDGVLTMDKARIASFLELDVPHGESEPFEKQLVVGEIACVGFRVQGDTLVTWRILSDEVNRWLPVRLRAKRRVLLERLRARWPEAALALFFQRHKRIDAVQVEVLTARAGPSSHRIPIPRLHALRAPSLVRIVPAVDARPSIARIHVRSANGLQSHELAIHLSMKDAKWPKIPLENDRETLVYRGTYFVHCTDKKLAPALRRAFPDFVEITPDKPLRRTLIYPPR